MFSHRDVTLLGSNALFLSLAAALYLYPQWAVVTFPLFTLIQFWSDLRRDDELNAVFLFLATIAALLLVSQVHEGPARAALIVELAGVWAAGLALGSRRRAGQAAMRLAESEAQGIDGEIRDLERDLKFYGAFESTAAQQVRMRRDVTDAAKTLGATMDAHEAQTRLVRVLQGRFQGSRVRILPGQPAGDPLVTWSLTTRASALVRDAQTDERFRAPAGFRSAIVSPLWVMKKPHAFVRLENDRPAAYTADDLRTVDLFSTFTSLALENIQIFEQVHNLATHDALTQLHTHKAFEGRLNEEVLRAGRSQSTLAVVMCDVDHFKRYNDTYGHQAGDLLLQKVAQILSNHSRPVDFVARYGGEEFALLLPGLPHAHAVEFADRLRAKVAEEPFVFQNQRTKVTMSFGVSGFPQDATTASQLLRAADERLYRSKTGGRNRVTG